MSERGNDHNLSTTSANEKRIKETHRGMELKNWYKNSDLKSIRVKRSSGPLSQEGGWYTPQMDGGVTFLSFGLVLTKS